MRTKICSFHTFYPRLILCFLSTQATPRLSAFEVENLSVILSSLDLTGKDS